MTTSTATKKPSLTAAEKRELEAQRIREQQPRAERAAAYAAESQKLLADSADLIAEKVEIWVRTGAKMIDCVLGNYTPRHEEFRLRVICELYDFGIKMDDRIDRKNAITMYGSLDYNFQVSHSSCGSMSLENTLEFADHLREVATLAQKIKDIADPVTSEYAKVNYRIRKEDRAADAIDDRVIAEIAKRADVRIQNYLRLRLGK